MTDRAQKKIARMVARRGMSEVEARAAMRLVAVAESAMGPPGAPGRTPGGVLSGVFTGGRQAINRRERQLVGQIADRALFQRWQEEMRRRGHNPNVTIGVLLLGQTMCVLDRRMKRRKGWARGEVRQGIAIFRQVMAGPRQDSALDKAGQKRYQIG